MEENREGGMPVEEICIIAPPRSLYAFGPIVAQDMLRRVELGRCAQGETICLPAAEEIELGIAWGRGSTPPVKLRFTAEPGHVYRLFWLKEGFGAGMGVIDVKKGLLHW